MSSPKPDIAPIIPEFPFRMRDAEILTVAYRSTAEAVARFVPEELEPAGDRVLLHFYRIHDAGPFAAYGELQVHLPVRHPASGTSGAFSPFMYLESDGATASGREIFGQPKKIATITLAPDGDLLVGRLRRNGIDVVTATMALRQRPSSLEALQELGFGTNINLKVIPSVDGSGPAVRELTARDFEDLVVHEVWEGLGTVELRPNAQAPVFLLPVVEVERAFYWRADFTAVWGRVLESLKVEDADPALV